MDATKQAYIEGRLLGLTQLITILKESMEANEGGTLPVAKIIASHMSSEMNDIIQDIEDLQEKHGMEPARKMENAEEKAEQITIEVRKMEKMPEPEEHEEVLGKHIETHEEIADDLLKNLKSLRQKSKASQ